MSEPDAEQVADQLHEEEDDLTPDQRALYQLMSDLSETCYAAGWISDNEYAIWRLIHHGGVHGMYSAANLWTLPVIKHWAYKIGYWIVWEADEERGGGPRAIDLGSWMRRIDVREGRALFDTGPPKPRPIETDPPDPQMRVTVKQSTDLKIDLAHLIHRRLDEYLAWPLERLYQWWEKPTAWLWDQLEGEHEGTSLFWTASDDIIEVWNHFELDDIAWTQQNTIDLYAKVGIPEDHGRGS